MGLNFGAFAGGLAQGGLTAYNTIQGAQDRAAEREQRQQRVGQPPRGSHRGEYSGLATATKAQVTCDIAVSAAGRRSEL